MGQIEFYTRQLLKKWTQSQNLTTFSYADTIALKDLDDTFTQAQVDNLVKEWEEWALRALNMKQLFRLDSLT